MEAILRFPVSLGSLGVNELFKELISLGVTSVISPSSCGPEEVHSGSVEVQFRLEHQLLPGVWVKKAENVRRFDHADVPKGRCFVDEGTLHFESSKHLQLTLKDEVTERLKRFNDQLLTGFQD